LHTAFAVALQDFIFFSLCFCVLNISMRMELEKETL
jgi:hypothetical protein